jgi:hypothetical protein
MKIVVLNDGETYTDLAGCVIVEVPDDMDAEDIEAWLPDMLEDGLSIENVLKVYSIIAGTA